MQHNTTKALILAVAEEFPGLQDDIQAAFFNEVGKWWRLLYHHEEFKSQSQMFFMINNMNADGKTFLRELVECLAISEESKK